MITCPRCGAQHRPGPRYDLAPLSQTTGYSCSALLHRAGVAGSEWKLYRCHGVTRRVAERLAMAHGLHPYEVWHDMVDHDAGVGACLNCGKPYVPHPKGASRRQYCSELCGAAYRRRRKYAERAEYRAKRLAEAASYYQQNKRSVLLKKHLRDTSHVDRKSRQE